MSDATRAVALTEAVKLAVAFEQGDKSEILDIARAFDGFLNAEGEGEPQKTSVPAKDPPAKPAGKPGRKPAKSEDEAVSQSVEDDKEADEPYPANKEGVQAIIAKLLQANKRKEAIALLKEFGAASATGVKDKDAAKFIVKAKKLLPQPESDEGGSDDGDLTA